ncbi:Ig-like domain-containing domain [Spartinivicinus poritis]|uniref:Ig-like domain-containing domain n=1 Tax=Spartinivicinus poritis TaxID=2994640 RepID=A0ABT5U9K9_9GAMM|nr:Ig-like domain-containing domain [Spartinivicinus sp. A2-2]MDE1462691.1 Ig-like domain-containing domain [Spartinivicinus sp. A2-2]
MLELTAYKKLTYITLLAFFSIGKLQANELPLCSNVFGNGVQSHYANGNVFLAKDVQIDSSSQLIQTPKLTIIKDSTTSVAKNCSDSSCKATGQPSAKLTIPHFPELSSRIIKLSTANNISITLGESENENQWQEVNLGEGGDIRLSPRHNHYRIGKLILNKNTQLTLPAGEYWIDELYMKQGSQIKIANSASVKVFIKTKIALDKEAKFNPINQPVLLMVKGSLKLGQNSQLYAWSYINGLAWFDPDSAIKGAISAKEVHLANKSSVQFQPIERWLFTGEPLCRIAPRLSTILEISDITPASGTVLNKGSVIVAGTLTTSLSNKNEIIALLSGTPLNLTLVGDRAEEGNSKYKFSAEIPLSFGENTLDLNFATEEKSLLHKLNYTYQPDDLSQFNPPKVTILFPSHNALVNEDKVTIYAKIESVIGGVTVSVNNGEPIKATEVNKGSYIFRKKFNLPKQEETQYQLIVRDTLGLETLKSITVYQDFIKPEITVLSGLKSNSEVNVVSRGEYQLVGEVKDNNIRSFTVNGNSVPLTPIGENRYSFETLLKFPPNDDYYVHIKAKDSAGYKDEETFILKTTNQLTMQWVSPTFPYKITDVTKPTVKALAALANYSGNEEFEGELLSANGQSQAISVQQQDALLSAEITLPEQKGDYTLKLIAKNSDGDILSELKGIIKSVSETDMPVKVSQITPVNGAQGVEPDSFISLQFSQPVKARDVTIEVKQTAHGLTYSNNLKQKQKSDKDVQFLFAEGAMLQQVNFDQSPVIYEQSPLPGEHTVAFYTNESLSYNAQIFVTIKYKGKEILRSNFFTRPLPTFIEGGVVNALGQTQAGVEVLIKELNRKTVTNKDGAFAFGFGDKVNQTIPGGRYTFIINPNQKIQTLGVVDIPVTIENGRRNKLRLLQAPSIQPTIPYQYIAYDKKNVSLAQEALKLKLGSEKLIFPENTPRRIHTQFIPGKGIVRPVYPITGPSWAYQLQPAGIKTTGPIHLEIDLPQFQGGYGYLPDTSEKPYYVLMVGYKSDKNIIAPVGIAQINHQKLTTLQDYPVNYSRLDYIGFYMPPYNQQELFGQYIKGELLFEQLAAMLNSVNE